MYLIDLISRISNCVNESLQVTVTGTDQILKLFLRYNKVTCLTPLVLHKIPILIQFEVYQKVCYRAFTKTVPQDIDTIN